MKTWDKVKILTVWADLQTSKCHLRIFTPFKIPHVYWQELSKVQDQGSNQDLQGTVGSDPLWWSGYNIFKKSGSYNKKPTQNKWHTEPALLNTVLAYWTAYSGA